MMIMKMKKNNNLVLINEGEKKLYFTSFNRAGMHLGLQANSIKWAVNHNNVLYNNRDEKITIELVDGSDIPYKYINNK